MDYGRSSLIIIIMIVMIIIIVNYDYGLSSQMAMLWSLEDLTI